MSPFIGDLEYADSISCRGVKPPPLKRFILVITLTCGNQTWPIKWNAVSSKQRSILQYGCTTWTLTKRLEKKLDRNYIRMLRAILNKSWRQHPTKHQLCGHLPPITKTIQVRRTRHAGHYLQLSFFLFKFPRKQSLNIFSCFCIFFSWSIFIWNISDALLWTPTYGRAKAGRSARTYIQQLCEDTGWSPEDLPEAMNDREKCRERVRDIGASGSTWWWWWCIWW